MADRKSLDFEDYRQYAGSPNATKQSQMQDFMSNQNKILTQMAGQITWLPATSYSVGNVIYCGQGLWAKCTTGGTSGSAEPVWTLGRIVDGAVVWNITETISSLADAVSAIAAHIAANNNPHGVTKSQLGLGSVVNSGDTAIPASGSDAKFTAGGAYIEFAKKLDKNLGQANAGKMLQVGSDGMVTLVYTVMPVASVVWLAGGAAIPTGFLLCNGQAVSRVTYATLFASIGTTYGNGDGSTTFNLPNLIDKFIQGSATAGTVKDANIRYKHYHAFGWNTSDNSGEFLASSGNTQHERVSGIRGWNGSGGGGGFQDRGLNGDANMITSYDVAANSGHTVQPPALTMKPVIKF